MDRPRGPARGQVSASPRKASLTPAGQGGPSGAAAPLNARLATGAYRLDRWLTAADSYCIVKTFLCFGALCPTWGRAVIFAVRVVKR